MSTRVEKGAVRGWSDAEKQGEDRVGGLPFGWLDNRVIEFGLGFILFMMFLTAAVTFIYVFFIYDPFLDWLEEKRRQLKESEEIRKAEELYRQEEQRRQAEQQQRMLQRKQ